MANEDQFMAKHKSFDIKRFSCTFTSEKTNKPINAKF
jgi:hypothetical protein